MKLPNRHKVIVISLKRHKPIQHVGQSFLFNICCDQLYSLFIHYCNIDTICLKGYKYHSSSRLTSCRHSSVRPTRQQQQGTWFLILHRTTSTAPNNYSTSYKTTTRNFVSLKARHCLTVNITKIDKKDAIKNRFGIFQVWPIGQLGGDEGLGVIFCNVLDKNMFLTQRKENVFIGAFQALK